MPPKYKLVYFNATGLGEPVRYLLYYGKIDFEDFRFEVNEWDQWKPKLNFGKAPVLEIDGKPIPQSSAICRYLGKQLGLVGKTDLENLQADSIVDTLTDLRLLYAGYYLEADEKKKSTNLDAIQKEHNPFYFSRLNKIVGENGGYFVNGRLTWADIWVIAVCDFLSNVIKEPVLDKYPNLKALREKVENLPGIKEYRAKRPKTIF